MAHQTLLRFILLATLLGLVLPACKTSQPVTSGDPLNAVGYGYQPLDPLPVDVQLAGNKINPLSKHSEVLNALSDETLRLAIGEVQGDVSISYGPAKIGYKGHSYEVIIDYIKFQTYPKLFRYEKKDKLIKLYDLVQHLPNGVTATQGIMPLYIGVGLRLKATITVNEGSVDLGNLFAIGAAAQAKKVTGTLIVQTLGVSGDKITDLIPMPSEVSQTSLQNAIMALGTIKSKIYDSETKITPRILGFYNTLGGSRDFTSNFIVNCLSGNPVLELH